MLTDHKSFSRFLGASLIALLAAFPSATGHASLETGIDAARQALNETAAAFQEKHDFTIVAPARGNMSTSTADLILASLETLPAAPAAPVIVSMSPPAGTEDAADDAAANQDADTSASNDFEMIGQLSEIQDAGIRKTAFVQILSPVIDTINASILQDRMRLQAIKESATKGLTITAVDQQWLIELADTYKVEQSNLDELLKRVDIVPASLALSQAAVESGWGTSSLAKNKLALFGQTEGDGFAAFGSLNDGIAAYIINLNTHRDYDQFRAERATERGNGVTPDGYKLARYLTPYSELGPKYVTKIRLVMKSNDFASK